ncbi:MAG: exodeoxyribonuclease III [Gammaproteobacteria bacterium]|nr:exodeoxyribonuclease III [Gammaproteobacteria bacterium]
MRIVSVNVNGIRSAARKGFFDWIKAQDADVVCIQEIKAKQHQITDELFSPKGYHCFYHEAEKPGYSGVAVYSRHVPDRVVYGFGWPDFDAEGRYLQLDFGELSVASLYMPSGSSSEDRQAVKYDLMDRFRPVLADMAGSGRSYVICGDWNIAHKKIDIKNWRGNQKNSGFLPEERAWMDDLFDNIGMVDAFRVVNQNADEYTWWSNRGQAWTKNVGWRIDYQVVTPDLRSDVMGASIYRDERFSDHAPLIIDYDRSIRTNP